MSKYTIQRYRQLKHAEIENQVILLQGPNKAGKSSAFWAIRSLLLANPTPDIRHLAEGWKKTDLIELVQGEQGQAAIRGEFDQGEANMVWPDGTYETRGVVPYCSPVAAGMLSSNLAAMSEKDRAEALGNLLLTKITLDDFRAALPGFQSPPPPPAEGQAPAQDIPALLQASTKNKGWRATLDGAKANLLAYKKQWQELSGEAWGSQKMLSWRPAGWAPSMEDLTLQAAQSALDAAAEADREASAGAQAATGEITRLQALANTIPALLQQLENAKQLEIAETEKLQTALEVKGKLPPIVLDMKPIPCPHCQGEILVNERKKKGMLSWTLHKPEEAKISEVQLKRLRTSHQDADQKIENAEAAIRRAGMAVLTANNDLSTAQKAEQDLQAMEGIDTTKIEAARNQLAKAQANVTMLQQVAKSRKLAKIIGQCLQIIDVLEPTGIRKTVMERYLPEFNKQLGEVSQALRIPPVSISATGFEVMIGNRRYRNEADSEQFRARIALQLATAAIDGSRVVLIDNDVDMDRLYYGAVVKALLNRGLEGIISVRANPNEKPPFNTANSKDLAIRQRVSSYWVEGGTIKLLEASPEEAAAQ
jgi:hypothetical protein